MAPPPPAATPPQTRLTEGQRTGAACDQLRGRLPLVEELDVAELGSQWVAAEATGACWRAGYFELVGIVDASNAAWEAYANERRR